MNIIWFTENYPPNKGGMSRSCDRIISNLRKHCTIHVYHFTNKYEAFSQQINVSGSYTAVPVFEDSSHTLNMLWAFIKERQIIKESSGFVAFGSHLCIKGIPMIAKWLNKPMLTCFRGNDFDNVIFSQKKQDLLYCIENSSAIACVSIEKTTRIKSMNLNEKVYFTPNSIHPSSWKILPSDQQLANTLKDKISVPNEKIIGLVGYLKQKKGIDFFIKCLQKSQLINKVHLRIVGELEPHTERQLIQNNISYSIAVPESKSMLIANYLICDVIAIPSIYDGMPNVVFEAAILNIPVLGSKAGGIPDVLNAQNSFLFDVLSENSLLEALSQFDNSTDDQLIQKTEQLRTRIKKEFSPEIETKNYLDIFNQIF